MLKQGDTRFLDDLTLADLEEKLHRPIFAVEGVKGLVAACSQFL